VQEGAVLLLRHGYALEHQHDGAPRRAHVDRLIGSVQHQHGLVHEATPIGVVVKANSRHLRQMTAREIVKLRRHTANPFSFLRECPHAPAANQARTRLSAND